MMVGTHWLGTRQIKMPVSIATLTRLITTILVVLLAWSLGRIAWTVMVPAEPPVKWQAKSSSVATKAQSGIELADLQAMQLFGQYQVNAKPVVKAQPVKQDAPQTRLNVTLVGVVASSNPQTALAVISNRGKQNTYGISEAIDGTRATVQAVFVDRVIIRNGGRDETLMLEGLKFQRASQSTAKKTRPSSKASAKASSSDLEKIKREIMEKPQNLLSYIRLSQVKRDGQLVGYRVNPGKERALFDSVGLKPNDLAVSLNGNDLTDQAVMAKLWGELAEATAFSLTVERQGQLHEIYIELQ